MNNLLFSRVLGFCILMLATNFSPVFAQESDDDKTLSPYFLVKSDNPGVDQLPLKSTEADVNIAGVIADVSVTQTYKNEGKSTLEAIYTFPASTRAAVYAMKMTIGDRVIEAEIREREKARQEYEAAKSAGKTASLLEQERPNVFTMNVANIQPGDLIKVEMKYTELLIPESAVYEFVYPTVVGPRYHSPTETSSASHDKYVATPYLGKGEKAPYEVDIRVNLQTGLPLQSVDCKTHKVKVDQPDLKSASVRLTAEETNPGNRDYILQYRLAGGQIESGLLLYEHEDENYFLAMVQPPQRPQLSDIPPREYIFIVDVSGSMNGYPLEVSKKLLRNLIVNLRPTDRFNVVLFAGTSAQLHEESVLATEQNIEKAINVLDNQRGSGSTQLLPALKKSLNLPRAQGLSRSFVIVTDGYISVEKQAFDMIRNNLNKANFFPFGIGSGVNRYLMEGMAHVGQSTPFIVTGQEGADAAAEKFRKYIQTPVLTQVEARFGGFEVYDVEPTTLPDVMAERPVLVYGKYKGTPKGKIAIGGYSGGKAHVQSINVAEARPNPKNAALRYLWAREKIRMLDDYKHVSYGDDSEIKKEVTELGLKYNLMTAYTSFVAVDSRVVKQNGKSVTVKQAVPLPENVEESAVGFSMSLGKAKRSVRMDRVVVAAPKPTGKPRPTARNLKVGNIQIRIPADAPRALDSYIRKHLSSLNSCDLNKAGSKRFTLSLEFAPDGSIAKVKVRGTNPDFAACVEAALMQWPAASLPSGKRKFSLPVSILQ
jgi:Ca-activated chloride channel family protein